MASEILIVGDPALRRDLIAKVRDCGYDVTLCLPKQIEQRLAEPPIPAAVIVCMEDVQAAMLLATLRRSRAGAMLPVVLFVSIENENQGLADVIDLGADHVVEAPIDPVALRVALLELAGPAGPRSHPSGPGWPESGSDRSNAGEPRSRQDKQDRNSHETHASSSSSSSRVSASASASASASVGFGSGQKFSLKRSRSSATDESDAWEVDSMGLDSIPDVEPEGDTIDADESHSRLRVMIDPNSERGVSQWVESQDEKTEHRVWQPPSLDRASQERAFRSGSTNSERANPERIIRSKRGVPAPGAKLDSSIDNRNQQRDRSDESLPSTTFSGGFDQGTRVDGNFNRIDAGGQTQSRVADRRYSPVEATQHLDHPRHQKTPVTNGPSMGQSPDRYTGQSNVCKTTSGQVGTIELARVFWRLSQSHFNGVLTVQSEDGLRTLEWNLGQIWTASSTFAHDSMEVQLMRSGVLTRDQLRQARIAPGTPPDIVLGELLRTGMIKATESSLLFGDYVLNIAYRVLAQCEGDWEQIEYSAPQTGRGTIGFDVDMIVFQGVRLQLDLGEIRSRLAGYSIFPRRVPGDQAPHEELANWSERYELSRVEVDWLRAFDGQRNFEQLLNMGGDVHQLWTLVYTFHVMERIDLPQAEAGNQVDPVAIDGERILHRLRLAREADYFELLGLDLDASRSEIRSAFSSLSKTFSDDQLEQQSRERYASQLIELRLALREARDILLDEVLRQAYAAHIGER